MSHITWTPSPNFRQRLPTEDIRFLIIHYTECDFQLALHLLTDSQRSNPVSAHYLIDEKGKITQLVDEKHVAWHAGDSQWAHITALNAYSIGIELVNDGHSPYPSQQMQALAPLCQSIQIRHRIPPNHVLGHSDIAPLRKKDPGPFFDWTWLAEQGVGISPKALMIDSSPSADLTLPQAQKLLTDIGYGWCDRPISREDFTKVLIAFQTHYGAGHVTGTLDSITGKHIRNLRNLVLQKQNQSDKEPNTRYK